VAATRDRIARALLTFGTAHQERAMTQIDTGFEPMDEIDTSAPVLTSTIGDILQAKDEDVESLYDVAGRRRGAWGALGGAIARNPAAWVMGAFVAAIMIGRATRGRR